MPRWQRTRGKEGVDLGRVVEPQHVHRLDGLTKTSSRKRKGMIVATKMAFRGVRCFAVTFFKDPRGMALSLPART